MQFIKDTLTSDKIQDTVFTIAAKANADTEPNKINSTLGSLFDEDTKLVAFDTFYNIYNNLDNRIKAKYAESFTGNKAFIEASIKHVLEDKIKLPHKALATSGGTGAVSMTLKNTLNPNDTVLLPSIGWTSYRLMAKEYSLKIEDYNIFDIDDIIAKTSSLATKQNKILIVINSPCHNPTGISYSKEDFDKLVNHFNSLSVPVIILNDIAYIDYSNDLAHSRDYLEAFNNINDNILVLIAFSLSKTMTSYGLRVGSIIFIANKEETLIPVYNTFEKTCRVLWSNINNAAMVAFAEVINHHKDEFDREKAQYIKLITERAQIFTDEAKAINLEHYPYQEGFFITLKFDDNTKRDDIHTKLMDNHIYTVKVENGIRISLCGIPKSKIKGLASRIKAVY